MDREETNNRSYLFYYIHYYVKHTTDKQTETI